ncbi:MAG: QueT transporter family protein, partial [Clostridia bacterium]|nr:QueT transporter family protein [Clostridia bacterium]
MNRKERINYIIVGSVIAAAYAGLTYLSNVFGLAYGPIQLRISEVLTLLPIFTPAAIPGLTVGCFLANIGSFNAADMIFGTFATFIAAILTYYLKNIRIKKLPVLSMLSPVIVNAVIIGFEIAVLFLPEGYTFWGFVISALEVGAGELFERFSTVKIQDKFDV